jgi:hypothetical protein
MTPEEMKVWDEYAKIILDGILSNEKWMTALLGVSHTKISSTRAIALQVVLLATEIMALRAESKGLESPLEAAK